MKSDNLMLLMAQLQTDTGILVLFSTLLILAGGGYYVYSNMEIRKRFDNQCTIIEQYKTAITNLSKHFERNKYLTREQLVEIIKGIQA